MSKAESILQRIANGGAIENTVPKLKRRELRTVTVHLIAKEERSAWAEEVLNTAFAEAAGRYLKKS